MEATAAPLTAHGVVEVFEAGEARGWIDVAPDAGRIRVGLCVNGEELVGTWALASDSLQGEGQVRHFRFALRDIWSFVTRKDRLTVRVENVALPIVGHGSFYSPPKDGVQPLQSLRDRKEDGYVFGQTGRLQLSKSLDKVWQDGVLSLFQQVNKVLEEKFGYSLFFCYGTLLGAVRENGFIGHDLDFDCAYASDLHTGAEAKAELQQVAFALIEEGYVVTPKWSCIVVGDKKDSKVKLDLFHLYYNAEGEIRFPFGVAGTSTFTKQDFGSVEKIDFLDYVGQIPANSEAFVQHVYGNTWKTPNPGFNWDRDRTHRAMEGVFHTHQVEEIYWANFYAHASYDTQSTFCDYVLGRDDLPSVVLDIGCGDGRDSYAFAKSGRQVVGVDRSHVAVRHGNERFEKLPSGENVSFAVCDVSDSGAVGETIMRTREENGDELMLFYARFFLHSIPESTQNTLLKTLRDCSKEGDLFAAEFRTDRDKDARKFHGKHYRRFQNAQEFIVKLQKEYRFDVILEQEGNGFSPYRGEDPHLLRIVASRSAR